MQNKKPKGGVVNSFFLAFCPWAVTHEKDTKKPAIGGVFQKDKQSRSFLIELRYAFFVLKYATNPKEFIWSLTLFPVRLITWIKIFWERVILKKDMPKTGWERIQSTK